MCAHVFHVFLGNENGHETIKPKKSRSVPMCAHVCPLFKLFG